MNELLAKFELLLASVRENTIVEDLRECEPIIDEMCTIINTEPQHPYKKVLMEGASKRIIRTIKGHKKDPNQAILFAWLRTIESCDKTSDAFLPSLIQVWMPVLQQLIKF